SRASSGSTFSGRLAAGARKSDRLPLAGEINSARHKVRVSTTSRLGDREMGRGRPYIPVASNLSLTTSELSAQLPALNPQRLLAESAGGGAVAIEDAAAGAEPDPEVSFVTRDLVSVLPKVKVAALVPIEDVVARVRDAATWAGGAAARPALASLPTGPLGYAAASAPYAGFEARIVPENATRSPKPANQTTGGSSWNERTVVVKKGESVSTILRDLGATPDEIKGFAAALGARGRDGGVKEGQKVRILVSAAGAGQRMQ